MNIVYIVELKLFIFVNVAGNVTVKNTQKNILVSKLIKNFD